MEITIGLEDLKVLLSEDDMAVSGEMDPDMIVSKLCNFFEEHKEPDARIFTIKNDYTGRHLVFDTIGVTRSGDIYFEQLKDYSMKDSINFSTHSGEDCILFITAEKECTIRLSLNHVRCNKLEEKCIQLMDSVWKEEDTNPYSIGKDIMKAFMDSTISITKHWSGEIPFNGVFSFHNNRVLECNAKLDI